MGKTDGDLAALIGQAKTQTATKPEKSSTLKVEDSQSQRKPKGPQDGAQVPMYQTMVAKQARLRPDQVDELTSLAGELQRGRAEPGERITANTLIRVAVDRLLAERSRLSGDSEPDLLKSLSESFRL